jgi:hypothetical protein
MGTPYTGNDATITAHSAATATLPDDTDLIQSETFKIAYRKLLDYLDFLQAHAALLNELAVFTAGMQISAGDLELTHAAIQAILKAGGGALQIGTKAGNASDVEVVVNGVVRLAALAAGNLDAKSQRIINVTDPTGSQDAVTKTYVDSRAVTSIGGAISFGTGWSDSTPTPSTLVRVGKLVMLAMPGVAAGGGSVWSSIATLAAGFRPYAQIQAACQIRDVSAFAVYEGNATIAVDGTVLVQNYVSGSGAIQVPFAIGNGDMAWIYATFLAA